MLLFVFVFSRLFLMLSESLALSEVEWVENIPHRSFMY